MRRKLDLLLETGLVTGVAGIKEGEWAGTMIGTVEGTVAGAEMIAEEVVGGLAVEMLITKMRVVSTETEVASEVEMTEVGMTEDEILDVVIPVVVVMIDQVLEVTKVTTDHPALVTVILLLQHQVRIPNLEVGTNVVLNTNPATNMALVLLSQITSSVVLVGGLALEETKMIHSISLQSRPNLWI